MRPLWFLPASRLSRAALRVSLVLACAAVPVHSVHAQTAQSRPPVQPDPSGPSPVPTFSSEVVVTPERGPEERERLPVATAVLTRAQIERLPAASLADVVEALPGFHMVLGGDSGLPPAPIARGFFGGGEAEYIKLLVDGIPIHDAESGLVDWRMLPAFAIDRVEALRGPGSAIYGDTALAGVVQAFTALPRQRLGRLDAGGGSFGARSIRGELLQPFDRAALDLIASYDATDGFRAQSDLHEGFTSASFRRTGDARQWTVRGSFNALSRDEPGALTAQQLSADREMSDPVFEGNRDAYRRGRGAFRFVSEAGPLHSSVLGYAGARTGERRRTLLLAPGLGDRAYRDISTTTAGVSLESSLEMPVAGIASQLRFGVDLSRSGVLTTYRELGEDHTPGARIANFEGHRWQVAGFAMQSADLGDRVRVHGGLRWDGLEDGVSDQAGASHTAWSPRAGAAVLVGSTARPSTLFVQVARAFKAATLEQLFDPRPFPDFQGGSFHISNPALEPQRATNVEGGVRQSRPWYRWELALYRMAVNNEIDFDPATFTYANIRQSTHTGAELDVALFPRSPAAVAFNYAWTRVKSDDPSSRELQLKNIPRHRFRPEVTLTLPRDVMLHAHYTRTAGAFVDDGNAFPLRDRSTLDMRIAARLRRFTARLDLLNVTNERYEEVGFVLQDFAGRTVPFYYPAQGFTIRAGLEWSFRTGS